MITWLRSRLARRRLIRAFQLDLGWSRRKSTLYVDAMLAEYRALAFGTRKERS